MTEHHRILRTSRSIIISALASRSGRYPLLEISFRRSLIDSYTVVGTSKMPRSFLCIFMIYSDF
jgi:hypothetical protein